MNLLDKHLKSLFHVQSRLCTHFLERDFVLLGEGLSLLLGHLSLIGEIRLCSDEHLADISWGVGFDLSHPTINVLKGASIDDGISEDDAGRSFVVGLSDILEPFLASSVPDLELVSAIANSHGFDLEVDSDSGHI